MGEAFETKEKKKIVLSVRGLVEFLLRKGDLDRQKGGFADREAMQKGSRLHRKIQKQMGTGYRAEVPLSLEREYDTYRFVLEGRADGIFEEEDMAWIDEIKGIYRNVHALEEPVEVHQAQAKCYAWIYCRDHAREKIGVQMTYGHLETEEIRRFRQIYKREELETWFEELLEAYRPWAEFQASWEEKRTDSIEGLAFPFPYRKGQKEMTVQVYRALTGKKQLFVQAPTGIGKTISAVFPAVHAVGKGMGDRIFYLTAKTIARTVAEEAFHHLTEQGLYFKYLTITAKEKVCVLSEPDCTPAACQRAKGHYDRIGSAVYEMLTEQDRYDWEAVLAQAEKWQVCPYELQLELSLFMDGIICDYNYVFDPNARLKRFFGEGGRKTDALFLIDEAHNLVDRGREMYSASLCKEDVLELKGKVKEVYPKLAKRLEKLNRQLLQDKRGCDVCTEMTTASHLMFPLLSVLADCEEILTGEDREEKKSSTLAWQGEEVLYSRNGTSGARTPATQGNERELRDKQSSGKIPPTLHGGEPLRKELLEFYFNGRNFAAVLEELDENYLIYGSHGEGGRFSVHLFCVNPGKNLQTCLDQGRGAVFFSATLLPVQYYRSLLSDREEQYGLYLPSPFDRENRLLLIGTDVSARYKRRTPEEFRKLAEYLHLVVKKRTGNYMAFFPSYQMMEQVAEVYLDRYGEENVCLQKPSMGEKEKEEFLLKFRTGREKGLLGFCVMGGIFAEGIDLEGESLVGAIVIGTGLPKVNPHQELLKDYYDRTTGKGFDYAYRFPGMNKVLQAAGRVIRRTEDEGVILLLDDRFGQPENRSLFPEEWADANFCTLQSIEKQLDQFWQSRKTV